MSFVPDPRRAKAMQEKVFSEFSKRVQDEREVLDAQKALEQQASALANQEARELRLSSEKAERDALASRIEKRELEDAEALRQTIHARYAALPEPDFDRLYPQLRDEYLIARSKELYAQQREEYAKLF